MSEFISKEKFVDIRCDCAQGCDVYGVILKSNLDLLFHKWMLDQGIDEFKFIGGLRKVFEIEWDFYKHLFDRKESGCATELELAALERFERIIEDSIKYIEDEDEEAGD